MTILFTVTNDLTYDQRMHRICGTLASNGHAVTLVGRKRTDSVPLEASSFAQKRLNCFFQQGFLFYAEFNLRLFFYLLLSRYDAVCSIDLDTLPAGCFASIIRRKKRVFDAHEYFTEVPEVVHRPFVRFFWGKVAQICLPFYRHAYTVGPALAQIFEQIYGLKFVVVRNVPLQTDLPVLPKAHEQTKTLLYQGALNEGRGIETILEALQRVENVQLVLAGEGDLSASLREKVVHLKLSDRVTFLGYVKPRDLKKLTSKAWLGLNLLENRGLSYYYSLANKFFDSVMAGIPMLTMDFPEYQALNKKHEVAILLPELNPDQVAIALNKLLSDQVLYDQLRKNCLLARLEWNWEQEQKALLDLWQAVQTN